MRAMAILMIVGGAGLGVYAFGYDGGSAFKGLALIWLVIGVILFFLSAFVESKKKSFMTQMQQMNTAGATSMTGQTTNVDVEGMMGLDANDVLKSVMEAQQQSGGDPQAMAKMLQEKFGGQSVVINGDTQTKFSMTGEVLGSAMSSSPSNDMLNQLIKLRDSGAINDEQFEQQKKNLIDS